MHTWGPLAVRKWKQIQSCRFTSSQKPLLCLGKHLCWKRRYLQGFTASTQAIYKQVDKMLNLKNLVKIDNMHSKTTK